MIVACPRCARRYTLPDDAIGPGGRLLRCAGCGERWQAMPDATPSDPASVADPAAPVAVPLSIAPTTPAAEPASEPVSDGEAPNPFDHAPPFVPRARRWRWPLAVALVALPAAGAAGMVVTLGGWPNGRTLGATPLTVEMIGEPERRLTGAGRELFAVSGRIANPTEAEQPVPDICAELRDDQGRIVRGWTIPAPVARLSPGAAARFNSAEADVPPSTRTVTIRLATPAEMR